MTPAKRLISLADTLHVEAHALAQDSDWIVLNGGTTNVASALFAVAVELRSQASTLREIARLI